MLKRRNLTWYIICTLLLLTTACGNTSENVPGLMPANEPVTTPDKPNNKPVEDEQTPIVYENKKYGFSLELPADWKDRYTVMDEDHVIHFANEANNKAGIGGIVFTVSVFTEEKWAQEGEELMSAIRIEEVGRSDGKVYTMNTPTDVQYSSSDKKLEEQYMDMSEDVNGIKSTFKLSK
ncbi:hypothetical protein [Paenibacillus sp. GCM10028914]|uniref:hypothetical protein n=1 Tax=Paenibacillus sp. GCM10028914 TaxID=3273416 RepID=UPI00360F08CE